MYPFNTTAFVMAANKTMFEEAGLLDLLPLEKEDRLWTIEEFEAALRGIKEANPDIIPVSFFSKSTAGDQGTRAFLANIFGGSIFNDDLTEYNVNSPEMVEALDAVTPGIANDHTLFYGVEAKFYSDRPEVNKEFETKIHNLYVGGDGAGITRGLAQAGASGVWVARSIKSRL